MKVVAEGFVTHVFQKLVIGCSLALGGCALHPLPEDVTGVDTYTIVRKVRCEARYALKDNLVQWLKLAPNDPVANRLGIEFENGTRPLNTFGENLFRGPVSEIIQKFQNSAIAYDFSFDMTETNNLDATLDLVKPLRQAIGTAALGVGVDRARENIRSFTITDTFASLLTKVKDDYCNLYVHGKDYLYPISGDIGVGEMIHTFVELSLFANLSGDPKAKGPPTMADKITFTTTLSGSATPKIVFVPAGRALQVANASLTAAATRKDAHTVTVALALPTPPSQERSASTSTQEKVGFLVNARGTSAELTAAHTIEQMIMRFELGKSNAIVVPNQ